MADNNELQIEVGVTLDTSDISSQLSGVGKNQKIKIAVDTKDAEKQINDLKKSVQSKTPAKIKVDVLKGESQTNINSFINDIQTKLQAKPIKVAIGIDTKATQDNINKALTDIQNNVQKQMKNVQQAAQQAAQQAGQANNTQTGTHASRSVYANTPSSVPVDKYVDELNRAIDRYETAFSDSGFKVAGFQVIHDELSDSYSAAVRFNNALGETTNVMFKLQNVLDDSGNVIDQEWVTSGQRFSASFKEAGKDVEKTLDYVQNQMNKLQTSYDKAFDKNAPKTLFFEPSDIQNASFAQPVIDQYEKIRDTLNTIKTDAMSQGLSHTADQARALSEEFQKLDTLIREQKNARWTATSFKETDINSFVERYRSMMTELSNALKDDGLYDKFSTKISNMFASLNGVKGGTISTGDFLNDLRNLKQEINTFESSVKGKGIMESFDIKEDQLARIQNLSKTLSDSRNAFSNSEYTSGIDSLQAKLQELADKYEDVQNRITAKGVSRDRLNKALIDRDALDKELRSLTGDVGNIVSDEWVSKQEAGIAQMKTKFEEYRNELQNTINLTPELQNRMDALAQTMSTDGAVDVTNWQNINNQFRELVANVEQYKNSLSGKASQAAIGIDTNQIAEIERTINNLNNAQILNPQASGGINQVRQDLQSLADEYRNVMTQLQSGTLTQEQFDSLNQTIQALQVSFKDLTKEASVFTQDVPFDKYTESVHTLELNLQKLQTQYANLIQSNPEIAARFTQIRQEIENIRPGQVPVVSKEISNLGKECQGASGQVGGLRGALQDAFGSFGSYISRFASGYFIITKVISGIKSMVNEVKAVDSSLLELQKVTELSGNALDSFTEKAYRVGEGLGRTGQDVIDAVTTFSRAGYDLQEATELAQSALVMTNIGPDIASTEAAASDMISILKAFDIQAEDSIEVIDKLYNVSNKEPLDFSNLTQMLVTAGGTLAQTGTTLDETMALVTGAFATMRDTSVANGLIMISQRLRGVKEDGEAIEEAGFMPKLKSMFSDVGIDIEDSNGELRSTYDILNDLAGVWDQLSSKQKQFFGEKVAGNRQVKTLNAIMQNWDVVADTIQKADEAQGTALQGNEMYMESLAGKITQLKSAFQELSTTTINSSFVGFFIDAGTAITKAITSAGGLVPILTTVLGLVVALKGAKIVDGIVGIGKALKGVISGLGSAATLTSGWLGILIMVGGIIAVIVSAVKNAENSLKDLEDVSKTAKGNYEEQKTKVNELNTELSETKKLISELEGKNSLTVVEQDELSNLKEKNAQLEREIDLQNELARIAERNAREAAVKAVKAKEESIGNERDGTRQYITNALVDTFGLERYSDEYPRARSKGDIIKRSHHDGVSYKKLVDEYIEALPRQAQAAKLAAESSVLANLEIQKEEGKISDEEYEKAKKDALKWQTYYEESENWLTSYYNYLTEQTEGIHRVENAAKGSMDEYYNTILDERDRIGDALLSNQIVYSDKQGQSDIILAMAHLKDEVKGISKEISDNGEISLEDIEIKFPDLIAEFEKYGWTKEEVAQHLNEIFGNGAKGIGSILSTSVEDAISGMFQNTEFYSKTFSKMITEIEKTGTLSASSMKTLLEQFPDAIDYLESTSNGYTMTTDAMYRFIGAQNEATKQDAVAGIMERKEAIEKLEKEIDTLKDSTVDLTEADLNKIKDNEDIIKGYENEIALLKSVWFEANSATEALERYRVASKTANQDAEHTEGQGIAKTLKESWESGKVGTDDFKSGMDFFLGEGWEEDFEGDLDKAYQTANKQIEKYFGGDDQESAENFRKALVEKGFAQFNDDGSMEILHGSLTEIADAFGMSEDAARTLFGLLNSYSFGDQITFEKEITGAEEATAAEKLLADATEERIQKEKELNEYKASNPDDTEGISKLSEEFDNLTEKENQAKEAVETISKALAGEFDADKVMKMPLQEAKEAFESINNAISVLSAQGITTDITLGEGYSNLKSFLDIYGGSQENTQPATITFDVKDEASPKIAGITEAASEANEVESEIEIKGDNTDAETKIEDTKADLVSLETGNGEDGWFISFEAVDEGDTIGQIEAAADKAAADREIKFNAKYNDKDNDEAENDPIYGPAIKDQKAYIAKIEQNFPEGKYKGDLLSRAQAKLAELYEQQANRVESQLNQDKTEKPQAPSTDQSDTTGLPKKYTDQLETWVERAIRVKDSSLYFGMGGKVDLNNRPKVPWEKTSAKGYDVKQGDISTLLSTTGRIGENGEIGIVLTPILPNGDVLEPGELGKVFDNLYVEDGEIKLSDAVDFVDLQDVLVSAFDLSEILPEDYWDSYLTEFAKKLHEVQEELYLNDNEAPELELEDKEPKIIEFDFLEKDKPDVEGAIEEAQSVADNNPVFITFDDKDGAVEEAQSEIENTPITIDVDGISDAIDEAESAIEDNPIKMELDIDTLQAGFATQYLKDMASVTGVTDTSEGQQAVNELAAAYDDLAAAQDKVTQVKVDGGNVDEAAAGLASAAKSFSDAYKSLSKKVNAIQTVKVSADTQQALNKIEALGNKSVTIDVDAKIKGVQKNATGTRRAKKGLSLVDDGNGPELIEHRKDGTFEIGTGDGPRLTNLDSGDVVHTAEETKKIMSRLGSIGSFFRDGLNKAKSVITGGTYALGSLFGGVGKTLSKIVETGIKAVGKTNQQYGGNKNNKSKKSSKNGKSSKDNKNTKSFEDYIKKLFDWIEIKLDRINQKTQDYIKKAKDAISLTAKNSGVDKALSSTKEEIEINEKAAKKYEEQADKIAKKGKLSQQIIEKIKNGSIEISEYSEDVQKKIQEYQKWYEKARDCKKAVEELHDQEKELAKLKLDNISDYYSDKLESAEQQQEKTQLTRKLNESKGRKESEESYSDEIKQNEEQIKILQAERSALSEELNSLIKKGYIKVGDETYKEYQSAIKGIDNDIIDKQIEKIATEDAKKKVKVTQSEYRSEAIGYELDKRDAQREIGELQGTLGLGGTKTALQGNIKLLKDQNEEYTNEISLLKSQQKGLDPLSSKYQEIEKSIRQVEGAQRENNKAIIEYQKEINDLNVDDLSYKLDALANANNTQADNISLKQAQGRVVTKDDYQEQIKNNNAQIANLQNQNKALAEQQKGMNETSKAWQELQKQINNNNSAIRNFQLSTEQLKDSINQINLDTLEDNLGDLSGAAEKISDDISLRMAKGQEVTAQYYHNLISNGNSQIENLQKQKSSYQQLMDQIVKQYGASAKNSEKYRELKNNVTQLDSAIRDLQISTEQWKDSVNQIVLDKLGYQLDVLSDTSGRISDEISLRTAKGQEVTESYYNKLISNGKSQIENLQNQKAAYQKLMDEMVKQYGATAKNSEKYREFNKTVLQLDDTIRDLQLNTEQWKDSINQIKFDTFEHTLDLLTGASDKINDEIGLRTAKGKEITARYYENLISNGNSQIANLNKQKDAYQKLMNEMVKQYGASAKNSEKYRDLNAKVMQLDDSIRELTLSIVNWGKEIKKLELDKLGRQLDALTSKADRLGDAMSLHEAQRIDETAKTYKDLIDNGFKQIHNIEKQNYLLKKQKLGLDVNSEAYQELESQYQSNLSAINDIKVKQEQWNDSILDLDINKLQKYKDALAKNNDEYEKQKELEEAILNLEKARSQKTVRTYRENIGFVYEADQDAVKDATKSLEDLVQNRLLDRLDDLIDALEDAKGDTNVYDANGKLIGTQYTTPELGNLSTILSNYISKNNAIVDIEGLKNSLSKSLVKAGGTVSNTQQTMSLDIGSIIVNEANDGNELAKAIVGQFPNALLQALYKKQ